MLFLGSCGLQQNRAKKEGEKIDRPNDIHLLQEYYNKYREMNKIVELEEIGSSQRHEDSDRYAVGICGLTDYFATSDDCFVSEQLAYINIKSLYQFQSITILAASLFNV
jgi:hypothetical protein